MTKMGLRWQGSTNYFIVMTKMSERKQTLILNCNTKIIAFFINNIQKINFEFIQLLLLTIYIRKIIWLEFCNIILESFVWTKQMT